MTGWCPWNGCCPVYICRQEEGVEGRRCSWKKQLSGARRSIQWSKNRWRLWCPCGTWWAPIPAHSTISPASSTLTLHSRMPNAHTSAAGVSRPSRSSSGGWYVTSQARADGDKGAAGRLAQMACMLWRATAAAARWGRSLRSTLSSQRTGQPSPPPPLHPFDCMQGQKPSPAAHLCPLSLCACRCGLHTCAPGQNR